jgi:hypothetical protein
MRSWTLADIYESEAQQKAAVDIAKTTGEVIVPPTGGASADGTAEECGFICNLQKYGTGMVVGILAAGGVMLYVMFAQCVSIDGLGLLVPGCFPIPQNPIMSVVPTRSLGEIIAAKYSAPENPIMRALTYGAMSPCATRGVSCGLGAVILGYDTSKITTQVTDWLKANWKTAAVAGGGVVAVMFLMGRGKGKTEYQKAKRAARARYREELAAARKKYGTRGSQIARAIGNPRSRNVAAGFVDEEGIFHPIRASYDYSRKRAGEKKKRKR